MKNINRSHSDAQLTLGLLCAVQQNSALTQRSLAQELGVALGLVNAYLKRCAKRGLIKVAHAPSSRYMYYLTPGGFAEKSRLTSEFLSQSLSLFRQARVDYEELINICLENGWTRIALCGLSDLADILALYARNYPIDIVGVFDPHGEDGKYSDFVVFDTMDPLKNVDAYLLTTLNNPQKVYEDIVKQVPADRVLTPDVLGICRDFKQYEN